MFKNALKDFLRQHFNAFLGKNLLCKLYVTLRFKRSDFYSKDNKSKPQRQLFALLGQKGTVMKHYYINNNQTRNPGLHHEVHTKEHAEQLRISSKIYLGYFSSEVEAVQEGKRYYSDADGCAICCPNAHRG